MSPPWTRLLLLVSLLGLPHRLWAAPTEWVARSVTYAKCTGVAGSSNVANVGAGADVAHTLTCAIRGDLQELRTNTLVRACALLAVSTDASTVPPLLLKLKAGTTTLFATTVANTAASGLANNSVELCWMTVIGGEPGASVATYTGIEGNPATLNDTTAGNSIVQPVNLATNTSLAWTVASQWTTAGTASNSLTLKAFVVELLNNR